MMTDDIVKRLRDSANGYHTGVGPTEAADRIEELREHLYLTANTLQDSMDNAFLDSHSDNWIKFCKEVIADAKKLSKDK